MTHLRHHDRRTDNRPVGGFTLIELMVVVAILGLLVALLLPSLGAARDAAKQVACGSNLRQVGVAIHGYARDNHGIIPYGPKAPPAVTAANFYPATGTPTSLISLLDGRPVGLGLLLDDYLSSEPEALFCPGSDQQLNAEAELANVGQTQAQCSYYYRHGSATGGSTASKPKHIALDDLGRNRNGKPIRALALCTQFEASDAFAPFNVLPRTHHRRRSSNVLLADGAVVNMPNGEGRFTVDLETYADLTNAFSRILDTLEAAD